MKNIKIVIILLFAWNIIVVSQQVLEFPHISDGEFTEAKINRSSFYDGNSLWGLINGGADLYLEYGFDKLLLQEISWQGIDFRIEIYKMINSESAFGIFSIFRYQCSKEDTITQYICITKYQVQTAVGEYYISISNSVGNSTSQKLSMNLLENYLSKIDSKPYELPMFLVANKLNGFKKEIKIIKGEMGLQNGYPAWWDLLTQFYGYTIYIISAERDDKFIRMALIKFKSEDALNTFVSDRKNDPKNFIKVVSLEDLIYVESNLKKDEINKIIQ